MISAVPLSWFEYVAFPFFQQNLFAHLLPAIIFKSIFKRDVLSAERPTADWRLRFSRVSRSCSGAKSSTDAGTSLRHTRVPELPHRGRAPTPGYQGSTLWYLPPAPFPFYNTRMSCDCYQKSKYFCIDNTIALKYPLDSKQGFLQKKGFDIQAVKLVEISPLSNPRKKWPPKEDVIKGWLL